MGNKLENADSIINQDNIRKTQYAKRLSDAAYVGQTKPQFSNPTFAQPIASDLDALYEILRTSKDEQVRLNAATHLLTLLDDNVKIDVDFVKALYYAEKNISVATAIKRILNKALIKYHVSKGYLPSDPTKLYDRHLSSEEKAKLQGEIDQLRALYDKFYNQKGAFDQKYILLEKIGEGGMARIFKAQRREDDQLVAIKFLLLEDLSRHATPEHLIGRFRREYTLLTQRLNHNHIIKCYEYGEKDGQHFIVLEYIIGGTLNDLIKEKPLDLVLFKTIALQLCDAVGYIHQRDVIHRDINPRNVLIQVLSEVKAQNITDVFIKLADFGLAKDKRDMQLSRFTYTAGTADFCSPQQLSDPRAVDERDDIYSMGITFYQILTGHVMAKNTPYKSVNLKDPIQAEKIDVIIMKCITPEREDRWQNIKTLEEAIKGI